MDYDPKAKCSITDDVFGDGNEDDGSKVVSLSCHSQQIPCIFHIRTISKCLGQSNPSCPSCNYTYVNIPGPQPTGTMHVRLDKHMKCSGEKSKG